MDEHATTCQLASMQQACKHNVIGLACNNMQGTNMQQHIMYQVCNKHATTCEVNMQQHAK